jgi:hypothetical protein
LTAVVGGGSAASYSPRASAASAPAETGAGASFAGTSAAGPTSASSAGASAGASSSVQQKKKVVPPGNKKKEETVTQRAGLTLEQLRALPPITTTVSEVTQRKRSLDAVLGQISNALVSSQGEHSDSIANQMMMADLQERREARLREERREEERRLREERQEEERRRREERQEAAARRHEMMMMTFLASFTTGTTRLPQKRNGSDEDEEKNN